MPTNPKGECKSCKRLMTLPAHGLCGSCYDSQYPPHTRRKITKYTHKPKPMEQIYCFPRKAIITVFETSDGREFSTEIEAYKHQLDITVGKLKKSKGGL